MTFSDLFSLSWSAVLHRPYVYALILFFWIFATYQMGFRRAVTFFFCAFTISLLAEYSSVKTGFPLSRRHYVNTVNPDEFRDLYLYGVPYWGSLLFVFFSYASYTLAAAMRQMGRHHWQRMYSRAVPVIGAFFMALLDIVIGPLFLRGDRWFLGNIFAYDVDGAYFGVPIGNILGWYFLGFLAQWIFQRCMILLPWCRSRWRVTKWPFVWMVFVVFSANFIASAIIAWHLGEVTLSVVTTVVASATVLAMAFFLIRSRLLSSEHLQTW